MAQRRAGTLRIFIGFAPWIAYGVLTGAGWWGAGLLAGLLASLGLCAWDLRRGAPKGLELVTLGFFAGESALVWALGREVTRPFAAPLGNGSLAALAWASLLAGAPFTAQYAREDWASEYRSTPLFRRLNAWLTALWGVVFTTNAILGAASLVRPATRPWLEGVLPAVLLAGGVAASVVVPCWYPRRWAARQLAARDPYPWPAPTFTAGRARADRGYDVIVIGAGIGGLTAAALLADRGLSVLVLEQHYLAGGFCTSWPRVVRRGERRLRYVFDAGVHDVSGLGPRGPVRHLLMRLGVEGRLDWRRVSHEYVLPGLRVKVPPRAEEFVTALGERFPAEGASLRAFFAEMEAVYRELYADAHLSGGVPRPPTSVETLLAWPGGHPHAFRWMDVPFQQMLGAYVREPRLQALLSILSGYLSDTPGALAVGAMAPIYGYYFDGGYYPAGGSQALADALVSAITARGGEVRLRTPVSRILVERGRAAGVGLASGRVERAEAVVSNADVRRTFLELVGRERLQGEVVRELDGLAPSASAFVVFLGVDDVPDVEPLTIVAGVAGRDGGLGIAIPSKVDPSLAPPGHSAVTLTALVPQPEAATWDRTAAGYRERKRRAGDALIARAEQLLPGLSARIVYREDGSPATFARYAWTTGGAIYGPALGQGRAPARSPVERLVLAGAGVFPGAGVEAVVISGTLAAEALCPVSARPRVDAARSGLAA